MAHYADLPTLAQAELLIAIEKGRPPITTTAVTWAACEARGWVETPAVLQLGDTARHRWYRAHEAGLSITPAGREALARYGEGTEQEVGRG